MVKLRVTKEGGISGRKHRVGDVVEVKSSLAPVLVKDGRAEFADEAVPGKKRAGTRSTASRAPGRGPRAA